MKHMIVGLSIILTLVGGAFAQHSPQGQKGKNVTIIGEVIDPVCYLAHDAKGPDHKKCAEYCVKQGMSLGILEDKTNQVYVSLPVDHTNPNAKLKDFVAAKVKVTGSLYTKGGLKGIHVQKVERLGQ